MTFHLLIGSKCLVPRSIQNQHIQNLNKLSKQNRNKYFDALKGAKLIEESKKTLVPLRSYIVPTKDSKSLASLTSSIKPDFSREHYISIDPSTVENCSKEEITYLLSHENQHAQCIGKKVLNSENSYEFHIGFQRGSKFEILNEIWTEVMHRQNLRATKQSLCPIAYSHLGLPELIEDLENKVIFRMKKYLRPIEYARFWKTIQKALVDGNYDLIVNFFNKEFPFEINGGGVSPLSYYKHKMDNDLERSKLVVNHLIDNVEDAFNLMNEENYKKFLKVDRQVAAKYAILNRIYEKYKNSKYHRNLKELLKYRFDSFLEAFHKKTRGTRSKLITIDKYFEDQEQFEKNLEDLLKKVSLL